MSDNGASELLDLRGRPPAEQMQAAMAAVEQAAGGAALRIISELDVVATYVLPAAAERGVRCRLEPPSDGIRELSLSPGTRPASATESGNSSNQGV
ncbi:MAG: hypothetical protein F4Z25_04985 [Chloroflexi bacterium]|nr:hypothetical protein [Chloroflexota bacterium]MYE46457.1 hypothetical protein [Chloroflexota bacterium]